MVGAVAWFIFGGKASRRPTLVKNVAPGLAEPAVPAVTMMPHEPPGAREAAIASVNDGWVTRAARVTRGVLVDRDITFQEGDVGQSPQGILTPKAWHTVAQGRRAAAHPGWWNWNRPHPEGVPQPKR